SAAGQPVSEVLRYSLGRTQETGRPLCGRLLADHFLFAVLRSLRAGARSISLRQQTKNLGEITTPGWHHDPRSEDRTMDKITATSIADSVAVAIHSLGFTPPPPRWC
ncbi:hypothetical protein ACFY5D_21700, partial [Paeniglutamicibacter sp. NPDC012692]|uniref:hypothetical protein n=1 Tax=Paeniglutamicibacter sp. NPDC012692 TaxID=3364388 RepID=UPI0036C067A4